MFDRRFALVLLTLVAVAAGSGALAPAAYAQRRQEKPGLRAGETWRDAFDRGLAELRGRRYHAAIDTFTTLSRVSPEQPETYYNVACAYALLRKQDEALAWLESAMRAGFDDLAHLDADADLDALRLNPAYANLLRRRLKRTVAPSPFTTLDGTPADLTRLRDNVVLLVFWRSASAPSQAAMATANALQGAYGEAGLVILGVSDEATETQEAFADAHKLSFPLLRQSATDLPRPFHDVRAFPTAIVIDRDGVVRHRVSGAWSRESLEKLLRPLIAPAPDAPKEPEPQADSEPSPRRSKRRKTF